MVTGAPPFGTTFYGMSDVQVAAATQLYDIQATYDPSFGGSWSKACSEWDATILIEGFDVVVATEGMSAGSIKVLHR